MTPFDYVIRVEALETRGLAAAAADDLMAAADVDLLERAERLDLGQLQALNEHYRSVNR